MDALEQSLIEAWPGDTEFVILRASDWVKIRSIVNDLVVDERNVLDDVQLVPIVLEIPCPFGCNGERWVVQDDHDPMAWWPGSNGPADEQLPCPGCNADGLVPRYDGIS